MDRTGDLASSTLGCESISALQRPVGRGHTLTSRSRTHSGRSGVDKTAPRAAVLEVLLRSPRAEARLRLVHTGAIAADAVRRRRQTECLLLAAPSPRTRPVTLLPAQAFDDDSIPPAAGSR